MSAPRILPPPHSPDAPAIRRAPLANKDSGHRFEPAVPSPPDTFPLFVARRTSVDRFRTLLDCAIIAHSRANTARPPVRHRR
ncbi:hypothetical protein BDI4_280028 [Burkholderia diffusa]|nr:hypothetical protein BDI4_280028 [Burkholderia diffusa]